MYVLYPTLYISLSLYMPHQHTLGHQYDTAEKNQLIGAILSGKNVAQSARLLNMPYLTVSDIWKKYKKIGSTENHLQSGRPPKLTATGRQLLVRNALKLCRTLFWELSNHLAINISRDTVRRVLRAEGYHWHLAREVPYLTTAHWRARLGWAKMYRRFKRHHWQQIIW